MSLELIKEPIKVNRIIKEESAQTVVENDIIVPDVKPDIARILLLDGKAEVTDTRITDNKAVIDGTLNCRILYLTDEENSEIKSINTSSDFSYQQEIPDASPGINCHAKCSLEHIEYNILNGRKVNVRSIINMNIKTMIEAEPEITNDLTGVEGVQVLRDNVSLNSYIGYNKDKYPINELMEIPSSKPAIAELLLTDVKVTNKDYKVTDNKIVAKGELDISSLYIADDETRSIQFMEHQIPFTQLLDLQGISEDSYCNVDYVIENARIEPAEDSDGELRMLNCEVTLAISASGQTKRSVDMVVDAYAPSLKLEFDKELVKVQDLFAEQRDQIVLKDTIVMDDDSPEISEVFNVMCKPILTSYSINDDRITIEGILNCDVLYLSTDNNSPICCKRSEIPFKQNIDIKGINPDMNCELELDIDHCNYSMISSNEVEVRSVVEVSSKFSRQSSISIITDVRECPVETDRAEAQPGIIIYFTQPGDTLWSVAKRYFIPVEDLKTFNDFNDDDKLTPGQQIIIPKKVS